MNATRALTWASRALFTLGALLFAAEFVYLGTRSGSTEVTSSGETVTNIGSGEMRLAALIFAGIAWSWLAGAGMRTLAQGTSWPRVMLSIVELVGFGVIFAAPIYAVSGGEGIPAAIACFVAGFAVVAVSKIIAFVAFGAKEAVASIDGEVARVKDMYHQAQQRSVERTAPSSFAPQAFTPSVQTFMPSEQTFTPEPPAQEPPALAR